TPSLHRCGPRIVRRAYARSQSSPLVASLELQLQQHIRRIARKDELNVRAARVHVLMLGIARLQRLDDVSLTNTAQRDVFDGAARVLGRLELQMDDVLAGTVAYPQRVALGQWSGWIANLELQHIAIKRCRLHQIARSDLDVIQSGCGHVLLEVVRATI